MVALFLSVVGLPAFAKPLVQEDDPRILEIAAVLPEKPRIPFGNDAGMWREIASTEKGRDKIHEAEKLLSAEVPPFDEARYLAYYKSDYKPDDYGERRSVDRNAMLQSLTWAECLERRGRFIGKIVEVLESMCADRTWVAPAHDIDHMCFDGTKSFVDLGAMKTAQNLARTVALLEAKLPESIVSLVKRRCEERIFSCYRRTIDEPDSHCEYGDLCGWWMRGVHNWNPACHNGVVTAALCLLDSRKERARFILAAAIGVSHYIENIPDDGYCTEGIGYWNYGFGNYMELGLALREVTGGRIDIFANPKVRRLMDFGYEFKTQKGLAPAFADGGYGRAAKGVLAMARQVWPDVFSSSVRNLDPIECKFPAFLVLSFGRKPPDAQPNRDVLPLRTEFPISQVFIFRHEAPSAGVPMAIGFKGGHNAEFHNHNDIGSYSLVFGKTEVVGDPGVKAYDKDAFGPNRYLAAMRNSYGHPVPLPAGVLQCQGREFFAKVLSKEFLPTHDTAVLDLAGAYGDVPGLERLVRTFVLDREANEVTVKDEVCFSSPQTFETPIVTRCGVAFTHDPCKLRLVAGDGKPIADMSIKVSGGEWKLDTALIDNAPNVSPVRHSVKFVHPVESATVVFSFKSIGGTGDGEKHVL